MKKTLKKLLTLALFVIVLASIIGSLLQAYLSWQPEPITTEEICNILVSHELKPTDITASAYNNFPGAGLKECIVAEKDDIRFEFYNFDNARSAREVYKEAHTLIITTKMEVPRKEIKYHKANYRYYSLTAGGRYSVTTYVKNTAIYAYCDEDNLSTVTDILDSIKYIEPKTNQETPDWVLSVVRILQYALYIPVALVCRNFYWKAAYKSAGLTISQVDNFEKSRPELLERLVEISPIRKTTKMILMIYKYFLIPEYICIILAVIGCFTPMFDQLLNKTLGITISFIILLMGIIGALIEKKFKNSTN